MKSIQKLADVVDWRLCLGCGACAYICPQDSIRLHNFDTEGIRPIVSPDRCGTCTDCLRVCPAVESDFSPAGSGSAVPDAFAKEWGPVLEAWEGHATDPGIRFQGSSGGALTALAAYCLERGGMHGVLHTGADPGDPVLNRTRLSRTREELMSATGSRYSPASVCDELGQVESAPTPCAVIAKPAEISALANARRLRPALDRKVGVTMSFFCAESPSTEGTRELLRRRGVAPDSIRELRYRGNGWPGHFAPIRRGESTPAFMMTYQESWAFLQRFRPWSVHMWPDGSGELADISCGDPWYEKPDGKNPGFSLVVVRTERGREIVRNAIAAGYLSATPAERWKIERSQPGLLSKKGAVWGRRLALRIAGLPVTRFRGLDLFHCWRQLSWGDKVKSTLGTFRRIFSKRLHRRLVLVSGSARQPVAMGSRQHE